MPKFDPEVKEFVEQFVFLYLDSLRTSQQVESRYHTLTQTAKAATTRELRELAGAAAEHMLSNVDDIGELGSLDDNALILEALRLSLPDRD